MEHVGDPSGARFPAAVFVVVAKLVLSILQGPRAQGLGIQRWRDWGLARQST